MPGILLVCQAAAALGVGHLSRMLTLADALSSAGMPNLRLLVQGENTFGPELGRLPRRTIGIGDDLVRAVGDEIRDFQPRVIVFDLHPRFVNDALPTLFEFLSISGVRSVGVDSLRSACTHLDLIWIPSFFVSEATLHGCPENVRFGWDTLLVRKRLPSHAWTAGRKVLVLTGGTDASGQGATLPALLDEQLPLGSEIHWVRGPFAKPPAIAPNTRLSWVIHEAPDGLDALFVQCNYALTVFGVTFFELMQYGVPTVTFSPYGRKDRGELDALALEKICDVADCAETAVHCLGRLMADDNLAATYSRSAMARLSGDGAANLAEQIKKLTQS
jgi:spore coat polysaccharide biosynthesis predicted glycosyltransferase SpsG